MLSLLASAACLLGAVSAAPVERSLAKRAPNTAAPHFVVYADHWLNTPPDPTSFKGWNTFIMAFYTTNPQDNVQAWDMLSAADKASWHQKYQDAGINLMMAVGGATGTPTSSGEDPVQFADAIATYVKNNELDGVDIDYEDFNAMNGGTAVDWLVKFQTELRSQLPQGQYIITHAPVAPWFEKNETQYPKGDYLDFHNQVGDTVDWYNVQFYNQGDTEYTDCDTLLNTAAAPWATSSLFEIVANGVPADKLVLGKPLTQTDATNGYMAPADLATCVSQAKGNDWNGGLMIWQYPQTGTSMDAVDSFVSTVWGS